MWLAPHSLSVRVHKIDMDKLFTLTAVGLAYDGFGVVILGFAFFSKSMESMMTESGTYWGGNNVLLKSLIQSKVDGVTGTTLLVVGFILQWFGSINVGSEVVGQYLLGFLIATLLIYIIYLRNKLISSQLKKGEALRKIQDEEA